MAARTTRQAAVALGLFLAASATGSPGAAAATDTPSVRAAGAGAVGRALVTCANRQRRARGIAPLAADPLLAAAARRHARAMLRQGFFSHDDPQGRDPQERVDAFDPANGLIVGENIAAGYKNASATCRGWMNSTGHRRAILNPDYEVAGGGYARGRRGYGRYYVLEFGAPVEPPEAPQPTEPPEGPEDPGGDGLAEPEEVAR